MTVIASDAFTTAAGHGALRFLYRLNPLAKLAAPLPAMALLLFTRDAATPLAFLLLAYAVLLVGARPSARTLALLLLVLPVAVVVLAVSFSIWVDRSLVAETPVLAVVGPFVYHAGALAVGLTTALRLAALVALALISGLTTSGPDLVRAAVQHLRVPYRVGYTALAAYRFVPRFAHELEVIRAAHRVRGMAGGRGPLSAGRRWLGYVVPLLASAIRHAERVALSMDARAFGAHPRRTERHEVPLRARDAVFVAAFWTVSALLLLLVPQLDAQIGVR